MTGVPFRIETAGPSACEPGRRVLATGRVEGGVVHIRARGGDHTRWIKPDRDALAADLGAALRQREAAAPVAQAGRDAWPRQAAS